MTPDELTSETTKLAVGDWIEPVYNRRRRHSALGMISPVEYEDRLNQTAQAARPVSTKRVKLIKLWLTAHPRFALQITPDYGARKLLFLGSSCIYPKHATTSR